MKNNQLKRQLRLNKPKEKVLGTITKTSGRIFLKEISDKKYYLRWSWHFPWQVLSAEKQVGWLKMFLVDALHRVESVTVKRPDPEFQEAKAAGR